MDDEELKQFVSVHVKKGKWQVVMLFFDVLLQRRGVSEVERNDKEKALTLFWWPADEDEDLEVLRKIQTDSDYRIYGLDLIDITDKGVKHIAEALLHGNWKLNSLNLSCDDLTNQTVQHLAKALSSSDCELSSLDLSWCDLSDEKVNHLAEGLLDSNCKLISLNLGQAFQITSEGVEQIAKVLNVCQVHSLNLSQSNITDEGVKYLAEALKHSNCKLTSLNLSGCELKDEGVEHLAEALEHSNCKLTSLNISDNYEITDEGVKRLAEALKHSNCEFNSINISENRRITDDGVRHLAEALVHSNCKLYR